jgi:hypothetical protein
MPPKLSTLLSLSIVISQFAQQGRGPFFIALSFAPLAAGPLPALAIDLQMALKPIMSPVSSVAQHSTKARGHPEIPVFTEFLSNDIDWLSSDIACKNQVLFTVTTFFKEKFLAPIVPSSSTFPHLRYVTIHPVADAIRIAV